MPSLNTGNAILSNPIKVETTAYNVGIGGAASSSFKLQVTGTTNLTGALTGTSATFSGDLTIDTNTLFVDSTNNRVGIGTTTPATRFELAGSSGNFQIGSSGAEVFFTRDGNNDILANAGTSAGIRFGGQQQLRFATGSSLTTRLTIDSTGAATFSSTITAASTLYLGYDGTYGSTYRTLGLTGITNGTHRIFAGTADNLYIAAATGRDIVFWTDGSSGTKASISTTGAATFASSVRSNSHIIVSDGSASVVLQGYINNSLRIAESGSGSSGGSRGGLYVGAMDVGGTALFGGGGSSDINNVAIRVPNTKFQTFYNAADTGWAFSLGTNSSNDGLLLANNNMTFGTGSSATTRMTLSNVGSLQVKGTYHDFYTNSGNTISFDMNSTRVRCYQQLVVDGNLTVSGAMNGLCATGGNTGLTIQNTSNNTAATAVAFLGWNGSLTGSIQTYVNVTTYNTSSDYRLKEDLKEFGGLDMVSKLKMYDFKWKEADSRMYGGLAHEIQEVVPYAATGKKDEVNEDGEMVSQGVDYSTLVPLLVKAIQELTQKVENQQQTINSLINR